MKVLPVPVAPVIASLRPGETVVDLGSGGGFDSFLAARAVGPTGKVIGVDMTPEMITRARTNARKLEAKNVEFRLGEIEHLPVSDASVDLVISNCVINLSPDKPQVFREAFRALKPGGRVVVSDLVLTRALPPELQQRVDLLVGCVAGASLRDDYLRMMREAGFTSIEIAAESGYDVGIEGLRRLTVRKQTIRIAMVIIRLPLHGPQAGGIQRRNADDGPM